jgi:hypothetical protein
MVNFTSLVISGIYLISIVPRPHVIHLEMLSKRHQIFGLYPTTFTTIIPGCPLIISGHHLMSIAGIDMVDGWQRRRLSRQEVFWAQRRCYSSGCNTATYHYILCFSFSWTYHFYFRGHMTWPQSYLMYCTLGSHAYSHDCRPGLCLDYDIIWYHASWLPHSLP